jgi:hypothetical protein
MVNVYSNERPQSECLLPGASFTNPLLYNCSRLEDEGGCIMQLAMLNGIDIYYKVERQDKPLLMIMGFTVGPTSRDS